MKNIFVTSITIAASLLSQCAFAGAKVTSPVQVSDYSMSGSLGTTRNSADGTQFLSCHSDGNVGFCQAKTKAGIYKTCTTNDPRLQSVILSINGDSYVSIKHNSGICTNITLYHGSQYEPKMK